VSEIPGEAQSFEARVTARDVSNQVEGAVAASVIDEDALEVLFPGRGSGNQTLVESRQALELVENRDNDGDH
jgi:stage V sporulation protein SpoVS